MLNVEPFGLSKEVSFHISCATLRKKHQERSKDRDYSLAPYMLGKMDPRFFRNFQVTRLVFLRRKSLTLVAAQSPRLGLFGLIKMTPLLPPALFLPPLGGVIGCISL